MDDKPRLLTENRVHLLETIMGPVIVVGELTEAQDVELAKLARDDGLWLKLWDAGVNDVRLTV